MDILKRYFYGQMTPEDETRFQDWLVAHADEVEVQNALMEIMSEMEQENTGISTDAFNAVCRSLGIDLRFRKKTVCRKFRIMLAKAAACVLLLACGAAAYSFLVPEPQTEWKEKKIPNGAYEELLLSDGTRLHLKAGTRVTYPARFIGKERRIFVDGEIFAEVAEDRKRPFLINSGDVSVTVLGTTFNFKAYDDARCVELLLLDGAVQVDIDDKTRNRHFALEPGEMIQYDRECGKINLKDFNPDMYGCLNDNDAVHFFDLTMGDIVADLERRFDVKIVFMDESLANFRYFAWFTNGEDLDRILDALNIDKRMTFLKKDDVIYISKK